MTGPFRSVVTRFAPSPTGLLHLGHAFSALTAFQAAGRDGRFLLRIEDIDRGRCRPDLEAAIVEDLTWLGFVWEKPVRRQSEHFPTYERALDRLRQAGVVYPCFCTRAEIQREIQAAGAAPHDMGPGNAIGGGPIYPGTCRHLSAEERAARIATNTPYAWRLDVAAALKTVGSEPLLWDDVRAGQQRATPEIFGDVVLARKDVPTSYHLACTWDDAAQGVTLVTRGTDLFTATHIHRLLQALLELPTPRYNHHPLILDTDGRKFSKRDKAPTLRALRQSGRKPGDVVTMAMQSAPTL